MRKSRKIFILILVVIVGLLAGAGFSLLSQKNAGTQDITGQTSESESSGLEVGLLLNPTTIKPAGKTPDVSDLSKVPTSVASITYNNTGSTDLSGIQIWLKLTSESSVGVGSSDDAKLNEELSDQNLMVFDIADAKAGSLNVVDINIFANEAGEVKVDAEVRTKEGPKTKTQTETLTVK